MTQVILNIGTRDPDIDTPEFDGNDDLIRGVFERRITPDRLPRGLFAFSFFAFIREMAENLGLPTDFPPGSSRRQAATLAKNNLGIFSGAKTFQNVLELSLAVFDDNNQIRPFADFREMALRINSRYNLDWLRTEQNAAFRQSQAIEAWQSIQEDKDVFPLLRYSTIGDNRVRDEHRAIDQVIKPVDDPFWDQWFPPNGFNCRCIVERIRSGRVSDIPTPQNPEANFATNVGKTGLIFRADHPYLDVPAGFREARNNNFGFTIPTDTDIRQFLSDE